MITKKRTRSSEDGKCDALARKARDAERRLRASCPEAKDLPPEESRTTRAELLAWLDQQGTEGNADAQKAADTFRDDARESEQLRCSRTRPYKHLPAGLDPETVIIDKVAGSNLLKMRLTDKGTPEGETMIHAPADHCVVELWTPELRGDVAALKEAFNFTKRPFVRIEIADAIRSAADAVRRLAWIPIALDLVHVALLNRIQRVRGAVDLYARSDRAPPPTSPTAIREALVSECLQEVGFPPPQYVHVDTILWMLKHLAVGTARGGGRTRKISAKNMRKILADEKKLAREVQRKPLPRSAAKPV